MRVGATRVLLVFVIALSALVPSSIALADGPTRTYFPNTNFTVPSSYCGFPVTVEWLINQQYAKTFVPADGGPVTSVLMASGALTGRLTNAVTGKSIVQNFSGPVTATFYADGSLTVVTEGPGLYPFAAFTGSLPGYPPLFFTTGRSVARYDAAGDLLSFTTTSKIQDLCTTLAG